MDTQDLLNQKVRDYMSYDLITLKDNNTANDAKEILDVHNIHHIPIVNGMGNLIGIISKAEVDLVLDWGTRFGLSKSAKKNQRLLPSLLAKDIMQIRLVTITADSTLEACALIFRDNKFHSLPVVENGKLVGIITTYDLLQAAYRLPTKQLS